MSFVKFITSRTLLWQVVIVFVLSGALLIGFMQYLRVYTNHGQEIEVPDLKDLHVDQLTSILSEHDFKYLIIDSTYIRGKQPMLVYDQDPKAGSRVKEGRTIYLSVTSSNTPKVKIPDLIDLSLRKASIDLRNLGLQTGNITMRPDIAHNVVLEIQISGNKVFPGKEVPKGTVIDLVVGVYNVDSLVNVPNLLGLNIEEARFYLSETALYLGRINYSGTISDTSKALVIRQFPEVNDDDPINTMSYVDIWVAQN
jgi:beta-lactam-binding protein with PASTA domain